MIRKAVPDVISGQTLQMVSPRTTCARQPSSCATKKIAAVLVMEGERLVGIITERDMTRRVVAAGLDAETAVCADIMTKHPDTSSLDDTASDAISMMCARNYRHLPVVKGERVVGMVSVRDLYAVSTPSCSRILGIRTPSSTAKATAPAPNSRRAR